MVLDAYARDGRLVRLFDGNAFLSGKSLLGHTIELQPALIELPPYGHLAIGENATRRRLLSVFETRILGWFTVVHPHASVAKSAEIEEGCFVASRAVVGPDVCIGRSTIINHGAVVDHDCQIGKCCHVAPNATLGGNVTLGDEVLVGSGAVVLPGICIGKGVRIGAGAVVTHNAPPSVTLMGVPAKVFL